MATPGQAADPLREFGEWSYPRLVGTLAAAGMPLAEADAFVRRVLRRNLRLGLEGGSEFGAFVRAEVLDRARPPRLDRARPPREEATPAGAVALALHPLAWRERLATLATLVLGDDRLGPGRPDVLAGLDGDPATIAREAVDAVAPPGDGELVPSVRASLARRRRWTAVVTAAIVLVLIVIAVLSLSRTRAGSRRGPAPGPQAASGQWVAVVRFGPDAFALYPDVARLGQIIGVYAFTDRWACYSGRPHGVVAKGPWFLGIAADDRAQLERLVKQAAVTPITEARLRQTCLPPPPDSASAEGSPAPEAAAPGAPTFASPGASSAVVSVGSAVTVLAVAVSGAAASPGGP